MTDTEKAAAFERWLSETHKVVGSHGGDPLRQAFMAGIATLERQRDKLLAACEQTDFATTGLAAQRPTNAVSAVLWEQLRDAAVECRAAIAEVKGQGDVMADTERDWRLSEREWEPLTDDELEDILDDTGRDCPSGSYCAADVYALAREVKQKRDDVSAVVKAKTRAKRKVNRGARP